MIRDIILYLVTHNSIDFELLVGISEKQNQLNDSIAETKDIASEILEIIKK